jgi:hypothetical protein
MLYWSKPPNADSSANRIINLNITSIAPVIYAIADFEYADTRISCRCNMVYSLPLLVSTHIITFTYPTTNLSCEAFSTLKYLSLNFSFTLLIPISLP